MANISSSIWNTNYWDTIFDFSYANLGYSIDTNLNVLQNTVVASSSLSSNSITGSFTNGATFQLSGYGFNGYNPVITEVSVNNLPHYYINFMGNLYLSSQSGYISYAEIQIPNLDIKIYGNVYVGSDVTTGAITKLSLDYYDYGVIIEGYLTINNDSVSGTISNFSFSHGSDYFRASGGSWNYSELANLFTAEGTLNYLNIGNDRLAGSFLSDDLIGGVGNDAIDGGAGIDTAVYTLGRSDYDISVSGAGFNINALTGSEGFDALMNVEKLVFSDMTVDLTMAAQAALLTPLQLQTLEELYVGFFNRVPEANGLSYWISQIHGGATLREVADQFYSAGVQFGVYDANMTEAQFITKVYENVLGRTGFSAPDNSEIGYWQTWLHTGSNSKGAMVLQMLNDSHNFFTGDPVVGWVIDLLDNKAAVANYFGIAQGISYNTPQENIDRGIAIAALITPTDISEAITLIGITDQIV